jgi:hypothetical protein
MVLAGALSSTLIACVSHAPPAKDVTTEARRLRDADGMADAKAQAPQVFAQGDEELAKARAQTAEGDETGAQLHAETAEALFFRARVQARLSRAQADALQADRTAQNAQTERDALEKSRRELTRTSEELDVKLRIAREKAFPAPSGPASPERDQARRASARSLVAEAHLLCTAARLIGATNEDAAKAEAEVDAAEHETQAASALDKAARARVHCLTVLEKSRKDEARVGTANDSLLASLGSAGFSPSRAESGVVVTLTSPFEGGKLTAAATQKLTELGRVAREEKVSTLLVLHDDKEPAGKDAETDKAKADLAVTQLVSGGVDRANVKVELAFAKLPLFDPRDTARRSKNARLDVIFVR